MSIMHFASVTSASEDNPPVALSGLYDLTSINAINVGATVRSNHQDAFIQGGEPSNVVFGSMYSEETFVLGDNIYAEFVVENIVDSLNYRVGIQPVGAERPDVLCGETANSFGIAPNGDLKINNGSIIATSLTYANGDVLGILIDFLTGGACRFIIRKNDVVVTIGSLGSVNLDQELKYRVAATIGDNLDTNAEGSYFLQTLDQTYLAPELAEGFDNLARPRNIEFAPTDNDAQEFFTDPTEAQGYIEIVLNTNGTYDINDQNGGNPAPGGTWRLDGLIDTTLYEYNITHIESGLAEGGVGTVNGANIVGVWTTMDTTNIGIRVFANAPFAPGSNIQESDIKIQCREIADVENKTGIMTIHLLIESVKL